MGRFQNNPSICIGAPKIYTCTSISLGAITVFLVATFPIFLIFVDPYINLETWQKKKHKTAQMIFKILKHNCEKIKSSIIVFLPICLHWFNNYNISYNIMHATCGFSFPLVGFHGDCLIWILGNSLRCCFWMICNHMLTSHSTLW